MNNHALDFVRWEAPTVGPLEDNGLPPLPTGMKELDARIDGGMRLGEMYRLSGRPAAGKTTCALNIARCVALGEDLDGHPLKNGHNRPHPVLFFSLELSVQETVKRLFCGSCDTAVCGRGQGETDLHVIAELCARQTSKLVRAPIFVDEEAPLDVNDMLARVRTLKKSHGIELVIIDYLQLCSCSESSSLGRRAEVSALLLHLTTMAHELHLAVIVVEQTGCPSVRFNKKGQYGPPTPDDIQHAVAEYFDLRLKVGDSINSQRSSRESREISMFLCRKLARLTLPQIAEAFGKPHATVVHSCATAMSRMQNDPEYRDTVNKIVCQLGCEHESIEEYERGR